MILQHRAMSTSDILQLHNITSWKSAEVSLHTGFHSLHSHSLIARFQSVTREVVQWLAPRICSANREVGGSNLTVITDDPLW